MLVLLVIILKLTQVEALDCLQCLDVRNVSDCHTLVTCPADNICFTESRGTGDKLRFNLTCKPELECQTLSTTIAPPPTQTGSQNTDCAQCCAKTACNTYLCSMGTQSITSTGVCQDDPAFDCQRTSSFFDICSDIHHAKAVCKDFCGLCALVDGGWADWATWSACSVTCGNGTISRTRSCTNPSPAHGGLDCPGIDKQTNTCHPSECPIAGGWSAWSPWGSCSVSCGVGLQRRDRSCSNPYPGRYGDHCFGDDKVYKSCFDRSCSDGAWSSWSAWGSCSATCIGGQQSRTRTCSNPAPSQFGRDCRGSEVDKQLCNTNNCPATHGAWSSWSAWGSCSATCNGGLQARTRTCTHPAPSALGRACLGTDVDKQACNSHNCPEKKVAFSVYLPSSTLTSDSTATFTGTILNTGSYNMATGKFTCPVAGVYIFSLSLMHDSTNTGIPYCYFRVNGVTKTLVRAYYDAYDQSSGSIIVTLAVGGVVDLQCDDWDRERHYIESVFSGALITPS